MTPRYPAAPYLAALMGRGVRVRGMRALPRGANRTRYWTRRTVFASAQ